MTLKHFTAISVRRSAGIVEPIHIDDEGIEVDPLTRYRRHLISRGYSQESIDRYHLAGARLIDFLKECNVYGKPASFADIYEATTAYPIFLRDGAQIRWPELPQLAAYAVEIGFERGLAKNSFAPTLAGVNELLRHGREEALRSASALKAAGLPVESEDVATVYAAIDGYECWSDNEKRRYRQSTMLGGVVRVKEKMMRPRGLRNPIRGGVQIDLTDRDFPLLRVEDLLAQATSKRDTALWLLMAGGGLRLHEALNIRLCDIDVGNLEIFVFDPNLRRFGRDMPEGQRERFKGRTVSRVYLFEPLRTAFWKAIVDYLREEFIVMPRARESHLFIKLDGVGRGHPLAEASDTALGKQFKSAVLRADIPGPAEAPLYVWTLHSLRHLYGVYMLNYIPVPGGPGLRLGEVQMLMGHASPQSTSIYARHDRMLLGAKIEAANTAIFGEFSSTSNELRLLPSVIASRLRLAASMIEGA